MRTDHRRLRTSTLVVCLPLLFLLTSAIPLVSSAQQSAFGQQTAPSGTLKAIYVKGKWGYANQQGKIVIAPQFDAARPFLNGLAQVGVLDEELPEIRSSPNLKWGYIDESGRVRVELRYAILRPFAEGLAAVAVVDKEKGNRPVSRRDLFSHLKWGYVDEEGRMAIPIQFGGAGNFSEGLASVDVGAGTGGFCGPERKYGYIDRSGAIVIQPEFSGASSFQNGRAQVSIGVVRYQGRCACCAPKFFGKYGHIDKAGKFTLNPARGDTGDLAEPEW